MDKFDFMKVVEDILEECKSEREIKKRMIQMKVLITQLGEMKIQYKKDMEEFENEKNER